MLTDAPQRKGEAVAPAIASTVTVTDFAFFVMSRIIPNLCSACLGGISAFFAIYGHSPKAPNRYSWHIKSPFRERTMPLQGTSNPPSGNERCPFRERAMSLQGARSLLSASRECGLRCVQWLISAQNAAQSRQTTHLQFYDLRLVFIGTFLQRHLEILPEPIPAWSESNLSSPSVAASFFSLSTRPACHRQEEARHPRRLMTRFLCSPKTFLKVTSAFGSRYFAISFAALSVQGYSTPSKSKCILSHLRAKHKRPLENRTSRQISCLNTEDSEI